MADEQRFFFLDLTKVGVKGGCTKAGHIDWLEIDNWSFVMNQQAEPNSKGGRPMNTASSGTFSFSVKYSDPAVFANCASGNVLNGVITFEAQRTGVSQAGGTGTAGQASAVTYFQLWFRNVCIHAWDLSGDSGQKTENTSFSFEFAHMTYWPLKTTGNTTTLGSPVSRAYDTKSLEATAS